jgi:hypothetical protein
MFNPFAASARSRRGLAARVSLWLAALSSVPLCPPEAFAVPLAAVRGGRAKPKKVADPGLSNITFTGFRMLADGRALLFVELSAKVPVTVVKQKDGVVYQLEGARVALKNNKNPLITSGFSSDLLSARLVVPHASRSKGKTRKKADVVMPRVDLVLTLRSNVAPTHVMTERAGGAVLELTIARAPK